MDSSNIYRFNGEPFEEWTINSGLLYGFYPRSSLICLASKRYTVDIKNNAIIIPNIVSEIRGSCFRNNKKYKAIYIPKSVRHISNDAFTNTESTLFVYQDSYAEKYAKRKGIKYEHIK